MAWVIDNGSISVYTGFQGSEKEKREVKLAVP